jgi:O-antigen ligase
LFIALIRPQELIGGTMAQKPVVFYTLILTVIPFLFSKKNSGSPQLFLLICLIIIISLSAILNGWSGGILKYVPEFVAAAVIPFILFSKLINTPQKHRVILLISVLSALVMVYNGFSQKLSPWGVGWAGSRLAEGTRITYLGVLNDPNDLGMFFVMMIPFVIYFVRRSGGLLKLIWIAALCALLYGVFLTNSRGAFLGVLSLFGLWILQEYGIKKTLSIALLLLPVVFVVASKFRTIQTDEESAAGRIEAWYQGFQFLIHHPLFGVGMNSFVDRHFLTAHNSYVLVLAELGVVGFTTWLSFLLLTFFMLHQIAYHEEPFFKKKLANTPLVSEWPLSAAVQEEMLLAKVAFFSLFGFAVTAFFLSRSYIFLFYIYTGIGVSCYYRTLPLIPTLNPITFSQLFARLLLIVFAAILFLYLVVKILN